MAPQAASPSGLFAVAGRLPPALVCALALALSISAFADTPVEIPDDALRQCVENALAKDEGAEITQGDMAGLTDLVDCDGVSNLDGLEFATNLTRLSSSEGGVADLSPLSGLTRLRTLALYRHPVGDLAPLAALESLYLLQLTATNIVDLSPLAALPLRVLRIGETRVRDLSPLSALTHLSTLGLDRLDLSLLDLTTLSRLPSLTSLGLSGTTNVDLNAFPALSSLTHLVLVSAYIVSDLSSLASHTSLRYLDVGATGLRSLDEIPPSVLASLQYIGLSRNLLSEITPLLSGGELRRVELRHNSWLSRNAVETDIPALKAKGVDVLYDLPTGQRSNAEIVDDPALRQALILQLVNDTLLYGGVIGRSHPYFYEAPVPADKLARVPGLGLSNKGIVSLRGLERAQDLRYLWLSGNDVSDISPLADLPLHVLALDGNPIGDFGPLAGMEELRYLALDNTALREIPALPVTTLLQYLSFADNSISDLSPLTALARFIVINELWLGGNSISSLEPLPGRTRFLHLNDNQVADLAGPDWSATEELHIRNNALRDISPLLDAASLLMLDAQRNPLGEEALAVAETLRERGAAVLTGEAVPFLPAAGAAREGFVRVINRSAEAGAVFIEAWDDAGVRFGPVSLRMKGRRAVHFTSGDLQNGKAGLGLVGIGVPTSGEWRLALTSPLDIEVLSYVRAADRFLTPMHDVAAEAVLPTLNPGGDATRRSVLRLVNRDTERAKVVVGGYDDRGEWEQMPRAVDVPHGEAWTASAEALEDEHGLGDGAGMWRLRVPGWPWLAMSLVESGNGHLANLSSVPDNAEETADARRRHRVPLLPAAGGWLEGFIRVVNLGGLGGEVLIDAVDDSGVRHGPLRLQLDGRRTAQFNSRDLEQGNADKGLVGAAGAGRGDWRLTLTSALDLQVLSYVRAPDGFLAAMHDVAPIAADGSHRVPFFNPGSNIWRQSKLRLINNGAEAVSATVTGIDDAGRASTAATLMVPAGASLTATAAELETGGEGISGRLGDGYGKWRLRVAADGPLTVMNLLESRRGHLANMSTTTRTD